MKINEADLHHHLKSRMLQRGISKEEIEHTINKGWNAGDAKEGVEVRCLFSLIIITGRGNILKKKKLRFILN